MEDNIDDAENKGHDTIPLVDRPRSHRFTQAVSNQKFYELQGAKEAEPFFPGSQKENAEALYLLKKNVVPELQVCFTLDCILLLLI